MLDDRAGASGRRARAATSRPGCSCCRRSSSSRRRSPSRRRRASAAVLAALGGRLGRGRCCTRRRASDERLANERDAKRRATVHVSSVSFDVDVHAPASGRAYRREPRRGATTPRSPRARATTGKGRSAGASFSVGTFSRMPTTRPSSSMKIMSSGMHVLCIQNSWTSRPPRSKSIPWSGVHRGPVHEAALGVLGVRASSALTDRGARSSRRGTDGHERRGCADAGRAGSRGRGRERREAGPPRASARRTARVGVIDEDIGARFGSGRLRARWPLRPPAR